MEVLKFYTKDILRLKDVDTVYLLCRSGELKGAIKIGRYWRIEFLLNIPLRTIFNLAM